MEAGGDRASARTRAVHLLQAARRSAAPPPRATYRLQFGRTFRFAEAAALVSYLDRLGVSHLYASPYLKARPESTHGYDVIDHGTLNPAIGSARDYQRFVGALHRHGMGQVLDVVPNHMGIGPANPWWMDVLENGQSARHAEAFDIDWHPLKRELAGKVLLPLLGDQYGIVLERGELRLEFVPESGSFRLRYWEHTLPIDPRSYAAILRLRLDDVVTALGREHDATLELQSIITAATNLPPRDDLTPERTDERAREKESIKRRLATLVHDNADVRAAINRAVETYNGRPGDPRSLDTLDALIEEQAYRLCFWRVAAEEINYRRFFDINDLAAIRVERPAVLEGSHALVFDLVARGALDGLRVDHIDGLWDPAAYTRALQASALVARKRRVVPEFARASVTAALADLLREDSGGPSPFWVVVEKILGAGERLPDDWAIAGTTGYDFAAAVTGLFVDGANRRAFDDIYLRFTGLREGFREIAYACKRLIVGTSMVSELNVLGQSLSRLAARNRRTRDFTVNSLTVALREVVACFPVYRTYIGPTGPVTERDRDVIENAIARARRRNPAMDPTVFDFVHDTVLLVPVEGETEDDRLARRDFVMKLQQYTGPVTAKGLEDTAFYRYNRLVSLNEVGGDPEQFGVSPVAFHRMQSERARRWPHAMIATATHDTKRGEDARARISVLSELPREWRSGLSRWSRINRRFKLRVDGASVPDHNEEYLLYQTLLGAWPPEPVHDGAWDAFVDRIADYILKASKEAKVNTSWINPNGPYDAALQAFVRAILGDRTDNPFITEFLPFQRRVARAGMVNSLAQLTLKLAAPGVPDFYQGSEFWDLSLVDPDNRRPVDFQRRTAALDAIEQIDDRDDRRAGAAADLLASWPNGRIKLYLTQRGLTLRRACPDLLSDGAYVPLDAVGPRAEHICAFARILGTDVMIAVVPRLTARLVREPDNLPVGAALWKDTWLRLPSGTGGCFRDRYTGRTLTVEHRDGRPAVRLGEVFAILPAALLVGGAGTPA